MTRTLGIDVSVWQDNNSTPQQVNFKKAYDAGARFAFIKASQSTFCDLDFIYNWNSSKNAGLLRGAYHFLVWETKPETQAAFFWGLLKNDPGELPPVVDFEWWSTIPSNAINILWAFLVEFKRLSGKTCIVYTAPGFWQPYGRQNVEWSQFPLWIADYGANNANAPKAYPTVPKPWKDWLFWQYSSKGDGLKFGCESLSVDMNYFNGSLEELYMFANAVIPPYVPVEPEVPVVVPEVPITPPVVVPTGMRMKVDVSALNVRSGPGTGYAIKRYLKKGDVVDVYDINGSNAWIRIGVSDWACVNNGSIKYLVVG